LKPVQKEKFAVWVITPNGLNLAETLRRTVTGMEIFFSRNVSDSAGGGRPFQSLAQTVQDHFHQYSGHVFVMSSGIVVRMIAPLIKDKTVDPAVVVVDDRGRHAISLLSGHLGGANQLTRRVARAIGASAVITTATDVNALPAIDVLALEKGLLIETPRTIKKVNMALLKKERIYVHDPFDLFEGILPNACVWKVGDACARTAGRGYPLAINNAYVYVDDVVRDLPPGVLILRPVHLVAGIGCNRNTPMGEMKTHLEAVFAKHHLALASLNAFASIDLKTDEAGITALAGHYHRPIHYFDREALKRVDAVENPSAMVEKHVGVKSVCEAAAILAAGGGKLIVPKQTTKNVTLAIARTAFSSSESAPAVPII